MIARPVGQAHDVDVTLDEPGHYGAAAQIDDARVRRARRCVVAHARDAAVTDRDRAHHGVAHIEGVDTAVHQIEILRGGWCRRPGLWCLRRQQRVRCASGDANARTRDSADETSS